MQTFQGCYYSLFDANPYNPEDHRSIFGSLFQHIYICISAREINLTRMREKIRKQAHGQERVRKLDWSKLKVSADDERNVIQYKNCFETSGKSSGNKINRQINFLLSPYVFKP